MVPWCSVGAPGPLGRPHCHNQGGFATPTHGPHTQLVATEQQGDCLGSRPTSSPHRLEVWNALQLLSAAPACRSVQLPPCLKEDFAGAGEDRQRELMTHATDRI